MHLRRGLGKVFVRELILVTPPPIHGLLRKLERSGLRIQATRRRKLPNSDRESLKTGGGPPPLELNSMQDRVVGIIGNLPID